MVIFSGVLVSLQRAFLPVSRRDGRASWVRSAGTLGSVRENRAELAWTGFICTPSDVAPDMTVPISQEVPLAILKTSSSCTVGSQRKERGHQPTPVSGGLRLMVPCTGAQPSLGDPNTNVTHRHCVCNLSPLSPGVPRMTIEGQDLNLNPWCPHFTGHSHREPLQRNPERLCVPK